MTIVSVTGAKRSGKNTFAEFLLDAAHKDGRTVELASWASLLKRVAYEALNIPDQVPDQVHWEYWADKAKEGYDLDITDQWGFCVQSITMREFFQRLGTEACRNIFGENFWIEMFWRDFERNTDPPPNLLIFTDTRFDNEADNVTASGGTNVEIIRPELVNDDSHASESGVSKGLIDDFIYNDQGLEELRIKANVYYEGIKWL